MNKRIYLLFIMFIFCFLYGCNTHDLEKVNKKIPTCTENGYTEHFKCIDEGCEYLEGYQEIPSLGHNIIHYEGKEATCISDGYTEYDYCLRCFETIGYEVIEKLGHNLVEVEGKASTPTEMGHSSYKKCDRCDYIEGLVFYPCELKINERYFVKKLDSNLYEAFMKIYNASMNFTKQVDLDCSINKEQLTYLMNLLNYSCPELIQINGDYTYAYTDNLVEYVRLTYILNQNEYNEKLAEINDVIKDVCNKAGNLSDFDKELYAYKYIIENTKYNKYDKHSGSVYGCLVNGAARCEGYSKSFMLLMWSLGIECLTITGEANERHSWNIVNIDGKYYMCDPTWDDLGENEAVFGLFNVDYNTFKNASHIADSFYLEEAESCVSLDKALSYINGTYISKEKDVLTELNNIINNCINRNDRVIYIKVETNEQFNILKNNVENVLKNYLNKHFNNWSYDSVNHGDGKTYMFKLTYSSPK